MVVTIGLDQVEILGIIGALEEERKEKQTILIDLMVSYDAGRAILNDSVGDVVDYRDLEQCCLEVAKKNYYLLETFASALLDKLFSTFSLTFAKVVVSKKAYKIQAKTAFVSLEKAR